MIDYTCGTSLKIEKKTENFSKRAADRSCEQGVSFPGGCRATHQLIFRARSCSKMNF